jgi:4-hydroxybenzoate polyprenyltransferase
VLIIRLVIYLGLIAMGVALGMYIFTQDRRYLRFAWQLFKFATVFVVVFFAIFMMGRIILY